MKTTTKPVTTNLSVMWTDEMWEHMKTLREAGMDQSAATRWALRIAANMLEQAWINGWEDRGVVPQMKVYYKTKG